MLPENDESLSTETRDARNGDMRDINLGQHKNIVVKYRSGWRAGTYTTGGRPNKTPLKSHQPL